MKLLVTSRGMELTPALREQVRLRIHFALGRFTGKIERVSVRLTGAHGPRSGCGKVCAIRVVSSLSSPVTVRERHDDVDTALAFAAERAQRGVERGLRLSTPARTIRRN